MIGGKVLDASALAALIRGLVSAVAWFATAKAGSVGGPLSDAEAMADIREAHNEVARDEVIEGGDAVRALRPRR